MSEAVLISRVKTMKIGSKTIPQQYIDCFNRYIENVINTRVDQSIKDLEAKLAEERKRVVQEIRNELDNISGEHKLKIKGGIGIFTCVPRYTLDQLLDQIERGGK